MNKEWETFSRLSRLEALSTLTARLLRLSLFEKISRGQAQLHAAGLPIDLTTPYADWAQQETSRLSAYNRSEVSKTPMLMAINTKRNDF